MTRVIHTADTHIGYRQYHSPERQQDFLRAFEAVISDAVAADVDAVIHAGDLFHDTRPDLDDLMGTIRILRQLAIAEIPFLGVVGNHERTRDRQWLDLMADLDLAIRLDESGMIVGDVTFYGLDWVPPAQRDRLEYRFDRPETTHTALVAHGLFEPFPHADWKTEALLEAATVEFDALLLGDNHTPDRADLDGTWITYAGSTERTSADEREPRGYNVITFDDDLRIARRTIDATRPFEFVDVSLSGTEGIDRVRDAMLEREIQDAVVIVGIAGNGSEISPAGVEEVARDEGALVVRVIDRREHEDETERPAVQFADPDRAVREEIATLGMSPVGHMVDEVIRDTGVPDATVRVRVRSRVETLLDEAPEAFEGEEVEVEPPTEDEVEAQNEATEADTRGESPESERVPEEEPPTPQGGTESQTSIGEFR